MFYSIWVFVLLGIEAIRTYRTNPYLVIATHQIPTWTTPLALILVVAALVPGTSLLGHLCGVGMGYFCTSTIHWPGSVAMSANHILSYRWTRLPQVPRAPGVGSPLHRGQAQPPRDPPALRECRPENLRPFRRFAKHEQDRRECAHRAGRQHATVRTLNDTSSLTYGTLWYGM